MIDQHYWPTPIGWKVTIMLEECGLPYQVSPVNILAGEQTAATIAAATVRAHG